MHTYKEVICEFANSFVTDRRNDGKEFVKLADTCPEWVSEIVRKCHGDMMPDDWRYHMIKTVAYEFCTRSCDNQDDCEELVGEIADDLIDVYNINLLEWLSSDLDRAYYCNEAISEGLLSTNADIFERIRMGQYKEYEEIAYLMLNAISDVVEDMS